MVPQKKIRTKSERAKWVRTRLAKLYPEPQIPLDHFDDYSLLVAVLLSAQCTDVRVNKTTPALWQLAQTPEGMSKQSVPKVQEIIRPCGLSPQKAKAIVNLSKILVEKFQGKVPNTFEELESLPGVGHKTASVVMVQAFGLAAFPVDTHIHRLAKRWKLSNGKSVEQTEKDLKRLFAERDWAKLHLQIIYYGREFCQARGCDGHTCPICQELNTK